jgi:serine/threonine protein kinase
MPRTESEVLYIMEHAFRAVDYLHSNNLVHLDIKLENFVSVGGIIKMIDFTGVCHANHAEEVTCHYTMKYLPPGSVLLYY